MISNGHDPASARYQLALITGLTNEVRGTLSNAFEYTDLHDNDRELLLHAMTKVNDFEESVRVEGRRVLVNGAWKLETA